MPNRTTTLKKITLGTAFLLAVSITANADTVPAGDTLEFNSNGEAKVNGVPFQAGTTAKPTDLYADVVQVIQGPESGAILYLRPVEARKTGSDGKIEKLSISAEPRPFVPESDWKMYDAEGKTTDDPRYAFRVMLPYPMDVSSALFEAMWNECEGTVNGNYVGLPCSKNRGLSDDYVIYLKKNYLPCINKSLGEAGLPAAVSVHLQHDGTMADDQHSAHSLHNVGRAIDVMQITTTSADGTSNFFDFTKTNVDHKLSNSCQPAGTANCKFFERFRACWHTLQVARKCAPRHDGPIGTIGWEDGRHIAHHLHTSYPFCPNNKGYFITEKKK